MGECDSLVLVTKMDGLNDKVLEMKERLVRGDLNRKTLTKIVTIFAENQIITSFGPGTQTRRGLEYRAGFILKHKKSFAF